jgi:hypothetical protein
MPHEQRLDSKSSRKKANEEEKLIVWCVENKRGVEFFLFFLFRREIAKREAFERVVRTDDDDDFFCAAAFSYPIEHYLKKPANENNVKRVYGKERRHLRGVFG